MSHIHTTMFFWSPLVRVLCSTTAHSHLFLICAPVFSLGQLLTGHQSEAPAFQKRTKSSTITEDIVSVKKSLAIWHTGFLKVFFFSINQSSNAAFAFNWSHFRGSSCHVLGTLTDCSNFQNPQIMGLNAVAVLSRQSACMLGFTSAISDFSKLKTPLWSESLASGKTKHCRWYEHCTVMQ